MTGNLSTDVLTRLGSVEAEVPLAPRPWKSDLGWLALVIVGVIAAVIGGGVLSEVKSDGDRTLGLVFAVTGAALLAGGVALYLRRQARRGLVILGSAGFAFTRGGRTSAVAFSDIDSLWAYDKPLFSNGTPSGVEWRLEAAGRGGRLSIRAWSPGGAQDALAAAYGHVLAKTADAWQSRRRAGEALAGKGWRLDEGGLRLARTGTVALSELRFAEVYDGAACLWRGSEGEPFVKVPMTSANASLLLVLARRALPKDGPADTSTLGRVLFSRAPSLGFTVFLGLFVASLGGGALLGLGEGAEPVVSATVAGVFGLGVLGVAAMVRRRFRCYERGVELRGLFGVRTLRYDDLVGYDHGAVRMYHNGAYVGTTVTFGFHPETGKVLTYNTRVQGSDADFDRLHEHITRVVADRLRDRIVRDGLEVLWGKDARITRDALVFHAYKLIGKGPEARLPWSDQMSWTLAEGKFRLVAPTHVGAELRMAANARNFFPGLLLLARFTEDARSRKSA